MRSRPRNWSEGGSDGGCVEFGVVDLSVGWLIGLRHLGGLWNSSRGLCFDAPPIALDYNQSPAGSSAGAVKREIRDQS